MRLWALGLSVFLFASATLGQDFSAWTYRASLYLNSNASTGTNVADDLHKFPALVRLGTSTLWPAGAKSDGSDIRFAKSDGTPLPYEVERWDNSGEVAEIWVLVDTIFGYSNTSGTHASDSTEILMYWGNPGAASLSNASVVFDTANGFAGVWHMDSTAVGTGNPDVFRDGTYNGNHLDDEIPSTDTTGVVGLGHYIGPRSTNGRAYCETETGMPTTEMTISMWVWADTLVNWKSVVGGGGWPNTNGAWVMFVNSNQTIGFGVAQAGQHVNFEGAQDSTWQYWCGTYDGSSIKAWVDGSSNDAVSLNAQSLYTNSLLFSNYANNHFPGFLDEMRIETVARSASWIQTCHQNQSQADNLVDFGSACTLARITGNPASLDKVVGQTASFTVTATGTSLSYQWQRYVSSWSNVSGATSATYAFTCASTDNNTQYRCIVSGGCGQDTSDAATLTVCTPASITSEPSDTLVTSGQSAGFAVAAVGTNRTYQWERNDGSGWNTIGGATSASYAFTASSVDDSALFHCIVATSCASAIDTSSDVELLVCTGVSISGDPADESVWADSTASFTVTATGSRLSYKWQQHNGASWSNVSGATSATYSFTAASSMDGYRYRCIVSNSCSIDTSLAADLSVCTPPSISSNPSYESVQVGESASFTVVGSGTIASYQWQRAEGTGQPWNNITTGGDAATYTIATTTTNDDSTLYRCIVSASCGSATSTAALLAVCSPASISVDPSDQNGTAPDPVTFTVVASGTNLTYKWQRNNGSGWSNVLGGQQASYTFDADTSFDGYTYRCSVTAACGAAAISGAATLTVTPQCFPVSITSQPSQDSVVSGDSATFTISATGSTPQFQWERKSGANWNTIPGATSSTYRFKATTVDDGAQLRCQVSNACTTVTATSNIASLIVCTPAGITSSPTSQGVTAGEDVTFSVTATGTNLSYQWQWQYATGPWTAISGATSSSYTFAAQSGDNGKNYRCVVSATCGAGVGSGVAALTVCTPPAITNQPDPESVVEGDMAAFQITATGTSPTYQWQTNETGSWTNAGGNSPSYSFTAQPSQDSAWFRCIATACEIKDTSDSAMILVCIKPSISQNPQDKDVTAGDNVFFSVTAAGTDITYQWERDDGAGWTTVSGATSNTYSFTSQSSDDSAQFRCVVTGDCSPAATSSAALLVVCTPANITSDPSDAYAVAGNTTSFTVVAEGTELTYQWQKHTSSWSDVVSGGTSSTYSFTTASGDSGNQYRCIVGSGCGEDTSLAALLEVCTPVAITQNPTGQTVTLNEDATFSVTATGDGLLYQWQRNDSPSWGNISGATSSSYTFPVGLGDDNVQFRCIVSGECGSATSVGAALSVCVPVSVTTQPTNETATANDSVWFSVAASGTNPFYRWQENSGSGWGDVAGDGDSTAYGMKALVGNDGLWLRAIVEGDCGLDTSEACTLSVCIPPLVTGNPTTQRVTEGDGVDFSASATGTNISYQWQKNAGSWANVGAGGTSATYSFTSQATDDSVTYRCVVSGDCGSDTSTVCTLTVCVPASIDTDPSNANATLGDIVSFSVAASGTSVLYQWQRNNGGGWTSVATGGNGSSYSFTSDADDDGVQFRCIVTGECGSDTSTAATLTLCFPPTIEVHPADQGVIEANPVTFSVTATGTNLTYQWQRDDTGNIGGATSSTYTYSPPLGDNGRQFRCVVSGDCGSPATSNYATLTVTAACVDAAIATQPVDDSVVAGQVAYFSLTATGTSPGFQWEVDDGGGWAEVAGETASSYSRTTVSGDDGFLFRCVVTGQCGTPDTSDTVLLTVCTPPNISSDPTDENVILGDSAHFSVTAGGTSVSYQWEKLDGTWQTIAGATSDSFSLETVAADNNTRYRCVVSGSCGGIVSAEALLTVCTPVGITTQPTDQSVVAGETATFSVTGSGTSPSYQWEANGGTGWAALGGETSSQLNIVTVSGDDGLQLRCVVSGSCGTPVTSAAVLLSVCTTPSISVQPVGLDVTSGDTATFTVTASGTNITFQWQRYESSWLAIDGATSSSYSIATSSADDSVSFRCIVSGDCGSAVASSVALLTVCTPARILSEPADQSVVAGDTAQFAVTAEGTNKTFTWQSNTGSGYSDIGGEVTNSYQYESTETDSGNLYRVIVSADCSVPDTSRDALLSVCIPPSISTQPSSQDVIVGDTVTFGVGATGTNLLYQWQSNAFGSYANLVGEDSPDLTFEALSSDNGVSYRCVVNGDCGNTVATNTVTLTVCSPATISSEPGDQDLVAGQTASFAVTASGSGILYQWERYDASAWSAVDSATVATYSFMVSSSDDGAQFRCIVSGDCGTDTSVTVTTSVCTPASISTHPLSQTVTTGASVTFTVAATGSNPTYQWQRFEGAWLNIDAATSTSYNLSAQSADDGVQFRCLVGADCGIAEASDAALLTVCDPPVISEEPVDQSLTVGEEAILTVVATGTQLAYQWQTWSGSAWEDLSGETTSVYSTTVVSGDDGASFRCSVGGACGTAVSDSVVVGVCTPPAIESNPPNQTVDEGDTVRIGIVASGTITSYQWEHFNGSTWGTVAGANTDSITFVANIGHNIDRFRCAVLGPCGSGVTSSPCTLTVSNILPPTPQTSLDLIVLGATSFDARWATPEAAEGDVDSVFLCYGAATYPGYRDSSGGVRTLGFAAAEPAAPVDERTVVVSSGILADTKYYFSLWVVDTAGNYAKADTGSARTTPHGAVVNPLVVRGTYVDSTHVDLRITNYTSLPEEMPFGAYVDSVYVWYSSTGYNTSRNVTSSAVFRYGLAALKNVSEPYEQTVSLPSLTGTPDSSYYLTISALWRNSASGDSVPQIVTTNGSRVFMYDTLRIPMSLKHAGNEYNGTDTIRVGFSNTGAIDSNATELAVWYGTATAPDFEDSTHTSWIDIADVKADNPFILAIGDASFQGDTHTVHYFVALLGTNDLLSPTIDSSLVVGKPRPANTLTLTVEALDANRAALSWDRSGDSVRVWYGTTPVPLSYHIPDSLYTASEYPGTVNKDTVRTLEPQTTYFFGLQAFRDGLWTSITNLSSDTITTLELGLNDTIANTISFDTCYFDSARNRIVVTVTYDTSGGNSADSLQVDISYRVGTGYPTDNQGFQVISLESPDTTLDLKLSEPLMFDTTYYIAAWVRKLGTSWGGPDTNGRCTVTTPVPTWEAVEFFAGTDTLVSAFNGSVVLIKTPDFSGTVGDTLATFTPSATLVDGMVTLGSAFGFEYGYTPGPVLIGIKYDSLLAVGAVDSLRMYRDSAGVLLVEYDSYMANGMVWVETDNLEFPFLVLADTTTPTVAFDPSVSDTGALATIGRNVSTAFIVGDNIGNAKWSFMYGTASDGSFTSVSSGLAQAMVDTITRIVPPDSVSATRGIRIIIVVTDGVNTDTINVSRRVEIETTDGMEIVSQAWVPLRVTADVYDSSLNQPLKVLSGQNGKTWTYDPRAFRLFRWHETEDNEADSLKWTEYSSDTKGLFTMMPGRVVWLKAATGANIQFGSAVTVSLKEPYTIRLEPGQWTDFATPYKFDMPVADVLASSGADADTLQIYRWASNNKNVFSATPVYVGGFPTVSLGADTAHFIYDVFKDAYTAYNPLDSAIVLRFPPAPINASGSLGKERADAGEWSVSLLWREEEMGGPEAKVLCGQADVAAAVHYPFPPSFGKVRVGVEDEGDVYGHILRPTSEDNRVFTVVFSNSGARAATLEYALTSVQRLPAGMGAEVFNPETNESQPAEEWNRVSVSGEGVAYRIIVVGTNEYRRNFASSFVGPGLGLRGIHPSPVRSLARIRYAIPYGGVRKVTFRLFDLHGRQMWWHAPTSPLTPGEGSVIWYGTNSQGRRVVAGMYVVHMEAAMNDGSSKLFKQTITLVP